MYDTYAHAQNYTTSKSQGGHGSGGPEPGGPPAEGPGGAGKERRYNYIVL